jgi:hypothetical protein
LIITVWGLSIAEVIAKVNEQVGWIRRFLKIETVSRAP